MDIVLSDMKKEALFNVIIIINYNNTNNPIGVKWLIFVLTDA